MCVFVCSIHPQVWLGFIMAKMLKPITWLPIAVTFFMLHSPHKQLPHSSHPSYATNQSNFLRYWHGSHPTMPNKLECIHFLTALLWGRQVLLSPCYWSSGMWRLICPGSQCSSSCDHFHCCAILPAHSGNTLQGFPHIPGGMALQNTRNMKVEQFPFI